MMNKLTRIIFHPHDDPLLKYLHDDNQRIEPEYYVPIIPMILVNGADGIGTGWMTKIPNFNPREIVANLRRMLAGEEPLPMVPWFKGFKGTVEQIDPHRYVISGEVAVLGHNEIEITELPIRVWTQKYKESVMETLLHGSEKTPPLITDYKEYHTDSTVRFVVSIADDKMAQIESEGLHRHLKLQNTLTTTSMVMFDAAGCLRFYNSVDDILRDFYVVRLKFYELRKDYLSGLLQAESGKLSNQARFICEKCDNILVVENKKAKDLVDELRRRKYDPDPVRVWKLVQDREAVLEEVADQNIDEEEQEKQVASVKSGDYDYLLDMPMRSLTYERKEELLKKRDAKMTEYNILKAKSAADLWKEDLDHFMEQLQVVEDSEKENPVKKQPTTKLPMIKSKAKKNLVAEVLPSPKGKHFLYNFHHKYSKFHKLLSIVYLTGVISWNCRPSHHASH